MTDAAATPPAPWRILRRLAASWQTSLAAALAFMISAASFYTTLQGFLTYRFDPFFAFLIAFAAQSLLLLTSIKLGQWLNDAEPLNAFVAPVFAITLAFSVWFSFTFFLEADRQGLADAETARQAGIFAARAETRVGEVVSELERLRGRYEGELGRRILQGDETVTWRERLDTLAAAGDGLGPGGASRAEDAIAGLSRQIALLEDERETLLRARQDREGARARASARLERLEDERRRLRGRVERLGAREAALPGLIAAKRAEATAELEDGATSGWPGDGPVHRRLVGEAEALEDELTQAIPAQRADLAERLGAADETAARLRAELAVVGDGGSDEAGRGPAATIDARIAELREVLSRARAERARPGEPLDVALRDALGRFLSTPEPESFAAVADACTALRAALIETDRMPADLAASSCAAPLVQSDIEALERFRARAEPFAARCSTENGALRAAMRGGGNGGTRGDAVVSLGRECLQLSGLPSGALEGFQADLADLARIEDPAAIPFARTWRSVSRGEPDAVQALVTAGFIDLLILFTSFFSGQRAAAEASPVLPPAHEHESRESRIARAILRWQRPVPRRWGWPGAEGEARIDLDEIAEAQLRVHGDDRSEARLDAVKGVIGEQIRDVLAGFFARRRARFLSDDDGDVIVLGRGVLAELVAMVVDDERRRGGGASAPGAGPARPGEPAAARDPGRRA
ncbi:MAG: hypothetical protein ACFBWO_15250, partial [Paracoccaceae bacterium]